MDPRIGLGKPYEAMHYDPHEELIKANVTTVEHPSEGKVRVIDAHPVHRPKENTESERSATDDQVDYGGDWKGAVENVDYSDKPTFRPDTDDPKTEEGPTIGSWDQEEAKPIDKPAWSE